MSWAFMFAGIAGLYQANVLNRSNTMQTFLLLLTMLVSVSIAINEGIGRTKNTRPDLGRFWELYETRANAGSLDEYEVLEEYAKNGVKSVARDKMTITKRVRRENVAGWLIVVEVGLLLSFLLFPHVFQFVI